MAMMHGQTIFLSLFYMVKDAWILVFSDVSTGEVIWHRFTDCENEVICLMRSVCIVQSEIILPEGTVLPQDIKDFMDNQFSNIVLSPFSTYHTQREVAEKAVTHFGDLGLMEEDVWEALRGSSSFLTNLRGILFKI